MTGDDRRESVPEHKPIYGENTVSSGANLNNRHERDEERVESERKLWNVTREWQAEKDSCRGASEERERGYGKITFSRPGKLSTH